ncbi:Scn2a [Symbiodinium natans]|uniref:Scn2a protein n=1 Tax=Symbiodinium natans TaxID=878477 RepID=A0A812UZR2_9DINO|nr:Scn2a [Symbiodinium natans]
MQNALPAAKEMESEELEDAATVVKLLKAAGFSAAAISALGHPAAALRLAGFELGELRALGLDTSGLRLAGYSAKAMQAAGYTVLELKKAGYSARQLKDMGLSAYELKLLSFKATVKRSNEQTNALADELRRNDLHAALPSFKAEQMREADFPAHELLAVGYSSEDLPLGSQILEYRLHHFAPDLKHS